MGNQRVRKTFGVIVLSIFLFDVIGVNFIKCKPLQIDATEIALLLVGLVLIFSKDLGELLKKLGELFKKVKSFKFGEFSIELFDEIIKVEEKINQAGKIDKDYNLNYLPLVKLFDEIDRKLREIRDIKKIQISLPPTPAKIMSTLYEKGYIKNELYESFKRLNEIKRKLISDTYYLPDSQTIMKITVLASQILDSIEKI